MPLLVRNRASRFGTELSGPAKCNYNTPGEGKAKASIGGSRKGDFFASRG